MTNLTTEQRLQIIYEVWLAVAHNHRVISADSPKVDFFQLASCILEDKKLRCNTRQMLISLIHKSPAWEKVVPFLQNNNDSCARKGCQCSEYWHKGPNKECQGKHAKYIGTQYTSVPCHCQGYIPKEFK